MEFSFYYVVEKSVVLMLEVGTIIMDKVAGIMIRMVTKTFESIFL